MLPNHKKSQISIKLLQNRSKSWKNSFEKPASYNDFKDNYDDYDNDEDLYNDILGHRKSSYYITEVKEKNAIKLVLEREAYCFDVKLFAEKFVEAIFIEANKTLMQDEEIATVPDSPAHPSEEIIDPKDQGETLEKHFSGVKFKDSSTKSLASYWPKISEFNIKLGLDKIQNYVQQWERSDAWKFCVEFLGFECEDCSNIFVYEVEWSKPTMSYPIPQATASVYFAMEVYKMVPHDYDRCIEVTYIFECSTVIHHPGRINFQEKWLEDIIEAKLKFFKTITFSVPKGHCDKSSFEIPQILK